MKRFIVLSAAAVALCLAAPAEAQVPTCQPGEIITFAPESGFKCAKVALEQPHATVSADTSAPNSGFHLGVADVADVVVAVVVLLAGIVARAHVLDQRRKQAILTYGNIAYGVVNEIARRTDNKIDDKAAEGLRQVVALLAADGEPPPTAAEASTVKAIFDANHGNEAKMLAPVALVAPSTGSFDPRPQTPPAA